MAVDHGNSHKQVDSFDCDADDWKEKISIKKDTLDTHVKTEDVAQAKGSNFHLKRKLLRAMYESGFEKRSPVREESTPNIMMRNNVLKQYL